MLKIYISLGIIWLFFGACTEPMPQAQPVAQIARPAHEPVSDSLPAGLQRLLKAYPEQLIGASANTLIWYDSTRMPYDDSLAKDFEHLLTSPDLQDQLEAMVYPRDSSGPPRRGEDPGRVRYEPFFRKMYGESAAAVRQKLTTVIWLPHTLRIPLQVTTVNNVHKKIEAISLQLDTMPHLHKYLQNPGGTFNWRTIAGTNRLSMHSFGMTLDIDIRYANYWRWDLKRGDTKSKIDIPYRNSIPMELVRIFEQQGFIWGGKWYHYDTMHFEYRPELLLD